MNDEKNLFPFKPVTSEAVLKTVYSLKNNKRSSSCTIAVKILKVFSGSLLRYLTGVINPLDKENYHPISLLSHTSKIYKKYFSTKSMTT